MKREQARGECPACGETIVLSQSSPTAEPVLCHPAPFCGFFRRTECEEILRLMVGVSLITPKG